MMQAPEGSVTTTENHIATVETELTRDEILARLGTMSKRGNLAGYEPGGADGADASFAAHGAPFEGRVLVRAADRRAAFELHMPARAPLIFALVLVLTVWPGLPITDGFMHTFVWYERLMASAPWMDTWVWYLPLTAIPAPFAWRSAVRKSRASSLAHARETVERVAAALKG